jgi:hypothetical protein
MADFGSAGKKTVRFSEAGGTINATKGEFIICTLDVKGAVPLFTFGCSHIAAIHTSSGPPDSRYQWSVYDTVNSKTAGDVHILMMRFSGGAFSYRYRMELFDENMALLKTLKDVDYETTDPADVANDSIRLRTK